MSARTQTSADIKFDVVIENHGTDSHNAAALQPQDDNFKPLVERFSSHANRIRCDILLQMAAYLQMLSGPSQLSQRPLGQCHILIVVISPG